MTRRTLMIVLGAWIAWGLLWSAQQFANSRLGPSPISLWTGLRLQMPLAFAWALVTPGILWLGRRLPLEGRRWPLHAAVHLVVSTAVVFLLGTFYAANVAWVSSGAGGTTPLLGRSVRSFVVWVLSDGLLYWTVLFVDLGVRLYRQAREREVKASRLEGQLAQSRLAALKMQLHPHFLFNALHTIGTLVRTGQTALAVRVVAGLGDLLRRMLDDASTQTVSLEQELAFLRAYLEIEQIRFSDRLEVTVDVAPDALDASVPHLILQPLVENAIRHGIAPEPQGGRLVISARRTDTRLELTVLNNGRTPPAGNGEPTGRGVGLANTRARLTQLFGADYTMAVEPDSAGGTRACITIPYHASPPAPPE